MTKLKHILIIILAVTVENLAQFPASQNVKAELISEVLSIKPGEKFWVALRLDMDDEWHTYWRNPGDAGMPTEIDWSLPENFDVSDIYWPYPELFETGGLVSYGYKDEILLLSEITPPGEIGSDMISIGARVTWLECKETCLPGSAEVSLDLSVKNELPLFDRRWTDSFLKTKYMLPVRNEEWNYTSVQTDSSMIIESVIKDPDPSKYEKVRFLPYDEGIYNNSKPQGFEITTQGFRIEVKFADFKVEDPENVTGLLKLEKPDGTFVNAFEIMVPITDN